MLLLTKLLAVGFLIAYFWFWIRTLVIIAKFSTLQTIIGLFVPPLLQLYFFVVQNEELGEEDTKSFMIYFAINALMAILWLITL